LVWWVVKNPPYFAHKNQAIDWEALTWLNNLYFVRFFLKVILPVILAEFFLIILLNILVLIALTIISLCYFLVRFLH